MRSEKVDSGQWLVISKRGSKEMLVAKTLRLRTILLSTIQCLLLTIFGCKNPFEPPQHVKATTTEEGKGYFSLTIDELDMGRTVLPTTVQDDFAAYTLEFFKDSGTEANPFQLSDGVWADCNLAAGNGEHWYSFPVTEWATYRVWWNERGSDGNGTKTANVAVAARYEDGTYIFGSSASNTTVDSGWSTPQSFTAPSDGTVYIWVIPYNRSASYIGTYGIVYTENNSARPDSFAVDAFPSEPDIVEERTGANQSEPVSLDAGTWDLRVTAWMDTAKTKPAAKGNLRGIVIDSGVTVSDAVTLAPIVGSGEGTFSWNISYPDDGSVVFANMTITPLAAGGTPEQTLDLSSETPLTLNTGYYRVVLKLADDEGKSIERWEILHVYQNMESVLTHEFVKGHFIDHSLRPVTVPGSSLAAQLAWVSNYAVSGGTYTLEVTADETLAPQTLSYSGRDSITLHLKGSDSEKTVSLAGNGRLFTMGNGVTLVLDENITLRGHTSNTTSLVYVNSGGKLIMNTGSKITGNWRYSDSFAAYGGGVYVDGGTFTMYEGEISGNTVSGSPAYGGGVYVSSGTFTMNGGEVSGNTVFGTSSTSFGGGVYVDENGTFAMNSGKISGNTTSSSSSYGGGVYARGTFTMNGGEISGNTASGTSYSYGGGVYMTSGGTFSMTDGSVINNIPNNFEGSGTFGSLPDAEAASVEDVADFGSGARAATFTVTSTSEWNSAVNAVTYSSNVNYVINVIGDFSVTGRTMTTFGSRSGITVSIRGTQTISLSGTGSLLRIGADQTVILWDLSLNGRSDNNASLVYITGAFEMKGSATITGNVTSSSSSSGGVYVGTNATFTMNDGEISGNTASGSSSGGGVYVGTNAAFTMNGGDISGNTSYGGGVCVSGSGTFTMYGGKVSGNYASGSGPGGGVWVNGGTFTMENGEISGNTASGSSSSGGGVYVSSGTFTMEGGEIFGNTASGPGPGGGVYVNTNGTFSMTDGSVINNIPNNFAGSGTFDYTLPDTEALSAEDIADFGVGARAATFTVTSTSEWNIAVNAITYSSNENYIINVIDDFSVAGRTVNTFGSRSGITVSIRGMQTVSLSSNGNLLRIPNNQTVILRDLTLNGRSDNNASLVYITGAFEMKESVTITGNVTSSSSSGGGVYVGENGTFTMYEGEISGNTVSGSLAYGGGVYVVSGTFTMNGGEISGNIATGGGGVRVESSGTFTMNGGEISGNTVTNVGGGVYVGTNAALMMYGGEISGNTASGSSSGGGVYVGTNAAFMMYGGEISGNIATVGGGACVGSSGIFTMNGGEIFGNTVTNDGGGVFMVDNGTFRIVTGTIYGSNEAEALRNSASSGAALYRGSSGIAQRGTFSDDEWISSGDFVTTDNTIRVEEGELVGE